MRIALLFCILLTGCLASQDARDRPDRSDRGGYVITADEIQAAGYTSLTEMLVATVPGVRRSPDGSGVLLRGAPSVNARNDPLYVIDGVASNSGANHVNVYDIASVEVLAGTSSTVEYGMQGVNGVILIETKDR